MPQYSRRQASRTPVPTPCSTWNSHWTAWAYWWRLLASFTARGYARASDNNEHGCEESGRDILFCTGSRRHHIHDQCWMAVPVWLTGLWRWLPMQVLTTARRWMRVPAARLVLVLLSSGLPWHWLSSTSVNPSPGPTRPPARPWRWSLTLPSSISRWFL